MYKESYLLIENPNLVDLQLATDVYLELSSQNTWFYWGVGLTCLLLISLVIFTGVVFYWMLKYKKVKKMFENFKLTEEAVTNKK